MLASSVEKSGSYTFLQALLASLRGGFILAFHEINSEQFESLIDALEPNHPVPLANLIRRAINGERTADQFAITQDDGVGQIVRGIAKVAVRRNWPVTFYLPTNYLDNPKKGMVFHRWHRLEKVLPQARIRLSQDREFDLSSRRKLRAFKEKIARMLRTQTMNKCEALIDGLSDYVIDNGIAREESIRPPAPLSWDDVARLGEHDVISFGSHGVSHSPVSSLSHEELVQELVHSQLKIREATHQPVRHFCYPFGEPVSIGRLAPGIVAKHYDSAVTMRRGRLARQLSQHLLPRIPLYSKDDPNLARLKILTL